MTFIALCVIIFTSTKEIYMSFVTKSIVNNQAVLIGIQQLPNTVHLQGHVSVDLDAFHRVYFNVSIKENNKVDFSISSSSHEYDGLSADLFIKACTTALDLAKHYASLATSLQNNTLALNAIKDALVSGNFNHALELISLTQHIDGQLSASNSSILSSELIRSSAFNAIAMAIDENDETGAEPIKVQVFDAIYSKSKMKNAPFNKPDFDNTLITTVNDKRLRAIQAIRKGAHFKNLTQEHIWCEKAFIRDVLTLATK